MVKVGHLFKGIQYQRSFSGPPFPSPRPKPLVVLSGRTLFLTLALPFSDWFQKVTVEKEPLVS